jgi:hypothetical protein
MEKPFEVGEVVWSWSKMATSGNGWFRIVGIDGVWLRGDDDRLWDKIAITRNPVIPPKPKKIVTKEAIPYIDYLNIVAHARACGQFPPGLEVFEVPRWAKNIRCTYDIEE